MGMLSKAKLAAKREALKAVPKVIRDLSLEPLERFKPVLGQRPRASRPLGDEKDHDPSLLPPGVLQAATLPQQPAMRTPPVKAQVVGYVLPETINGRREYGRQAHGRAASHASKLDPGDYGTIEQLRTLLGLPPLYTSRRVHTTSALPEDTLIVSFDTEWEWNGQCNNVVEVGMTVLDTRDIINTAPGPFAHDWIAKAKTYHYVVDAARRPKDRMRACYFSDDLFADVSTVRRDILSVLQQAAHPPYDPNKTVGHGTRKVVLVGHSVAMDLHQMYHSPGLELEFFSKEVFLTEPTMAFDTLLLHSSAIQKGAKVQSAKLGKLVNWLGVHSQYRRNDDSIGCHNAGNDAAYTMIALLLYAVRWERIVPGKIRPLSPKELSPPIRALRFTSKGRAFKENKNVTLEKKATSKARSLSKEVSTSDKFHSSPSPSSGGEGFQPGLQKLLAWMRLS